MNEIIEHLKKINHYMEVTPKCEKCQFFKEDSSTDNFGSGDVCTRNPDITFSVKPTAVCDRWIKK